jgi:hypothetical protein
MFIELPNGQSVETDDPYSLDQALDEALKYVLDGNKLSKNLKKKESDLFYLIESCSEWATYHEYEDGEKELEKDGYSQMNSFIEYLGSLVKRSDNFLTQTSGEDTDTAPGMCSGYRLFWDSDSKSSGKLLNENISNDIRLIKQRAFME